MSKLFSIQEFSKRTGISKSTLRFYETKGLLTPTQRQDNGYRVYETEQIALAKLISSLRLADVPIQEIRDYLSANEEKKNLLTNRWIQTIQDKQNLLQVAERYLTSSYRSEDVYLLEKDKELVCWFTCKAREGEFSPHFLEKGKMLEKAGIQWKDCYLKYLSGREFIQANIGFSLNEKDLGKVKQIDAVIEHMDACLCIAISYQGPFWKIANGYKRLLKYASNHHWIPAGSVLEWYRYGKMKEVDIMMPVTKLGGDEYA